MKKLKTFLAEGRSFNTVVKKIDKNFDKLKWKKENPDVLFLASMMFKTIEQCKEHAERAADKKDQSVAILFAEGGSADSPVTHLVIVYNERA